ncbi:MAG: type II toxin-antitoxin system VapC family toxin [Anaerolineae bacterium]|nr:type II toxin-antitoxin system VapC family toxin [Anaerolineae bacterium]MDW8069789.1 type II toxin-antitoxin system VapC family toxin [Anaerolineae bacterium]
MTRIVVDASVSLKWALDDEDSVQQAVTLRNAAIFERRFQMFAPSLWVYEVSNGLRGAARRGRISSEVGEEALRYPLALSVRLVDPDPIEVYRTASYYDIATYDAAYLALAESLDAVLWTGDERLYTTLKQRTHRIKWMGEFGA